MFRRLFFIVIIINIHTLLCSLDELYEAEAKIKDWDRLVPSHLVSEMFQKELQKKMDSSSFTYLLLIQTAFLDLKVWQLNTMIDIEGLVISHDAEATESAILIIQALENKMNEIHESLQEVEKFMGPKKVLYAVASWHLHAAIMRNIATIELFVQVIDNCYEQFNRYRNGSYLSHDSFESLRYEIVQILPSEIEIIRKSVYEDRYKMNDKDVITAIVDFARFRSADICGTSQIISDMLMQLLKMLIIAELKTSTMLAYQIMHDCIMNHIQQECQRMNSFPRQSLEEQLEIYINIFSLNVAVADPMYQRACDPPGGNWTQNESFYELEKTVEPSLFSYNSEACNFNSCYNMMFAHNRQTFINRRCVITFYDKPSQLRPAFSIGECSFLGHIEACLLNSGPYRYHYVKSAVLDFSGRNSSCPEGNGQVIRIQPTPIDDYTACECNIWRGQNSVSLLAVTSEVSSNRVITGLRFVRQNNVLYIQIREGKLGPNGYFNGSSQSWKPISETVNPRTTAPIDKWNRVFFLDDLILPSGFALTGVKFNKERREHVTGFALKILGRPFDYKTGKVVFVGEWQWWQGSNNVSGIPLPFTSVSSVFTTLPHTVTSSDIKYVSLKPSRLNEDFGQSTLPLFDAVPIEFSVPSLLTGVGIFHKGVEGYAGLISLRVYGMKHFEYFNNFKLLHMFNNRISFNSSGI